MLKILKPLILVLIFNLLISSTVFAGSNFYSDYQLKYNVLENGLTDANINIKLINLSETTYIQSFILNTGFADIQNLKISDKNGPLKPIINKTNDINNFLIKFNKRIAGKNKFQELDISFTTNDAAKKLGGIWEINIPGISSDNENSNYLVTLNYPKSFGKPTYIKPGILNNSTQSGLITFTKKEVKSSGISLAFGNSQIYDMTLNYHLENKNIFSIYKDIALPPDTGYQAIQINSINPRPESIRIDEDGNWLAKYKLSPLQKADIIVNAKAKVLLRPRQEDINLNKNDYLKPQKYWEAEDTGIVNLAQKLKTPEKIFNYVVESLDYDFNKAKNKSKRIGAVNALNNPKTSVCLEFTDLFIAIARAAGIPAREVDGFAYTGGGSNRPLSYTNDILHAWPEYYDFDKKVWIMVDPTWTKATGGVDYFNTLDFDHIAFAIRGKNSEYPIPAGGYKLEQKKDIDVRVSKNFDEISNININLYNEDSISNNTILNITNNGNQAIDNLKVNLLTSSFKPNNLTIISDKILPFGNQKIPLNYQTSSILTKTNGTVKITYNKKDNLIDITIKPFYENKLFIWGGIVIVSICIIISGLAFGIRRLSIFKHK
jgi:transglutaminase-like putative cysteine protease